MFLIMATNACFCIGLAMGQKIARKQVRQIGQMAGKGRKTSKEPVPVARKPT